MWKGQNHFSYFFFFFFYYLGGTDVPASSRSEAVARQNCFSLVFSCFLGKQIPQVSVVTYSIVEGRIGFSKLKLRAVVYVGFRAFENVIIRHHSDLPDLNCKGACSKYLFGHTENRTFFDCDQDYINIYRPKEFLFSSLNEYWLYPYSGPVISIQTEIRSIPCLS